jgi:hypothetical protein
VNGQRILLMAAVWCVLVCISRAGDAIAATLVFTHVNVVPMDGERILHDQNVTIVGDRIASVESAKNAVPAGAHVVTASGKFLMPGLGEMHAHLPQPSDPAEYMRTILTLYVANGVTTVRCMLGYPNHLAVRRQVDSGKMLGPALFLAGPGLAGESVSSPEEGVRQVVRQHSEGWDMVKILPGLTRPEYDAIMSTARRLGVRTGGHVPADVGIEYALKSGQETIEHLDGYDSVLGFGKPMPEELLKRLALETREAGAWSTPTLVIVRFALGLDSFRSALARPELEYLPRFQVDEWTRLYNDTVSKGLPAAAKARAVQDNRNRLLKALNDVGAGILLGSDSPNLFEVPGFAILDELEAMQAAGLSPYDVLLSGTRRVGEYLRQNVGTVTVGARADLILLEANPLQNVANVRTQSGVVLRGTWLPRTELQHRLQAIHDLPGNYRSTGF